VIGTALSQGDTELAAGAEQLARILQAMREMAASEAHSALFELLMRTPLKDVLVEMADQGEWGSWLILLRAHPELCTNPFLEFLERIETSVREEDLWVLHALSAFLAECRDSGVDAAVSRWRSPVQAGERAALPPEYKIAAISHIAGLVEGRGDAAEAEALGNLGVLLYHRQLGDRAENLRCSAQLLKAASEQARALGEIMMKAQYQQALVNVLLLLDPEQGAASALAMADEALEGWEKKDDPELWGLLMTSMGNCLMRLRRTDEAIECYQQSLTVFGRDDSPRRWAISTFDLGGAYVERGMRGGDSTDFVTG